MKIVIEGAGEVGSHLARILSREANEISIIDIDQKRLDKLSADTDVITVQGTPPSRYSRKRGYRMQTFSLP